MSPLQAQLAAIWRNNLPTVLDRIAELDEAAAHLELPVEKRREARETAHKLAGSLGMFGFDEGTRIARKLEILYESTAALSPAELQSLTAALRGSIAESLPGSVAQGLD